MNDEEWVKIEPKRKKRVGNGVKLRALEQRNVKTRNAKMKYFFSVWIIEQVALLGEWILTVLRETVEEGLKESYQKVRRKWWW